MATQIVTIDIDSKSIRLLQVQGNRVERWATASLEAEVMEEGTIVDPQVLADQLRRLRRSSGIMGGQVIASVSGLFSVTRTLSLAVGPEEYILERVRDIIPGQDLRLLWQTLRSDDTGQDLLVVGANDHQVNTQAGLLQAAGLPPRVLEFKTMALSRTVDRSEALIANLEPTSLDLVLMADSLPRVMRTVALPDVLSTEERATRVAQALEHTVAYYDSHHLDSPLPSYLPFFLVGSMSEDPALRQEIVERVEYPVQTFAPDLDFPPHLPTAQYAVNMGLALRQVARPQESSQEGVAIPIRMNLVPLRLSVVRLVRQRARLLAVLVLGLALAFILFQLNSGAAQKVAELDRLVKQNEQQVTLKLADLNRLTQVEANIRSFENLTIPRERVTEAREAIEDILTPGIHLSDINISGNQASFTATAESIEEAMVFVEALRADGRFGAIPFSRPSTAFNVTLNLATLKGK